MLKFRFFTDSWYWTWNWNLTHTHPFGITSKAVAEHFTCDPRANTRASDEPAEPIDAINFFEMYFEKLGHQAERTCCHPGKTFTEIVDQITDGSIAAAGNNEVNVVFYSDDCRGCDLEQFLVDHNQHHVTELLEKLEQLTVDNLNRLGKFADEHDQHYLLIGGQGTLKQETVTRSDYSHRLHLIADCAVWTFSDNAVPLNVPAEYKYLPPPKWKLIDLSTSNGDKPRYEQMHPTVVDKIYTDTKHWREKTRAACFPDYSHMNAVTTLYVVDSIMHHIEHSPHLVKK